MSEMKRLEKITKMNNKLTAPQWLVIAVDAVMVMLGFLLAFVVRFGFDIPSYNISPVIGMAPYLAAISLFVLFSVGLYNVRRTAFKNTARLLAVAVMLNLVCIMALAFWARGFAIPRSVLLITPFVQFLLLILWRLLLTYVEKRSHGVKKILIVGHDDDISRMQKKVLELPAGWFEVFAVLSPHNLGDAPSLMADVDAVLLTEKVEPEDKRKLLLQCFEAGCDAFVIPDLYEILLKKSLFTQLDDTPVIEMPEVGISQGQLLLKRIFDLSVALTGLLLCLPLLLVISFSVAVTSAGPVFYTQERVGCRGRTFKLFKFRSMVDGAESESGPVLATACDGRITRVGGVLRRTRLDELPQLINIVRGDMSLVGPRPERPAFVAQFLAEIPQYRYRYLMKPGLTGLAQVRSRYSTAAGDKLRYDLNYVVNYSLLLDLQILLETIPALFAGETAVGCDEKAKDATGHGFRA